MSLRFLRSLPRPTLALRLLLAAPLAAPVASYAAPTPEISLLHEISHAALLRQVVNPKGEVERIKPEIEISIDELLAPPTSHASLSLEELQKLFETQDAAWRKAAPGSKERGDGSEAAAQSATDIAWKYFDAGEAQASGEWFARRAERKKEAYESRRTFVNTRLERQDKGRAQAMQEIEASWNVLQKEFAPVAKRLLQQLKQAGLPSRPIEYASAMAVQKIVMALQQEERAEWQKATQGKDATQAKSRFNTFMALAKLWQALSEADTFRASRWALVSQRQTLARTYRNTSDLLLFAAQDLQDQRNELGRARQVGETSEVRAQKIGDLADALDVAASARADMGQVETALKEHEEAIALRKSLPRTDARASLQTPYHSLGRLYSRLGQPRLASEYFEKALLEIERTRAVRQARAEDKNQSDMVRTMKGAMDTIGEVVVLNNLAVARSDLGDPKAAFALLDRAIAAAQTINTGFTVKFARSLLATTRGNRAVLLFDMEEGAQAAPEFEAVAKERRELGEDDHAATALLNAAGAYEISKETSKAQSYAEQARRLFLAAQDLRGFVAATNFGARLAREAGKLDEAENIAGESHRVALSTGDKSWIAVSLRERARVRLAQNRFVDALQVLEEAQALDIIVGAPLSSAKTLELEGDGLRGQITDAAAPGDEKRHAAIEKYKAAIALIEGVRDKAESQAFSEREDSFRPYQSLVALLIQAGRADEAFDYLQRARSKKLRDSLRLDAIRTREPALQNLLRRAGIIEGQLRVVERAIQSEQARPESERDARKIGDLQRVAASTQSEFLRLTRELRAKNPSYDKVIAVKPTALKEAQADIPEDVALVQYAPLGEQLYIFVVTRESLKIYAPPVKPAELSTHIREFRRLMDVAREKFENGESISIEDWATQKDSAPLRDNLTTLYSMLLAPIENEVANKKTLAFIPTQLLCYLPLHALAKRTPEGGMRFLIEDKRVAYLAAADVMKIVRPRRVESLGRGVMALGNPKGADLPFAGEEARDVAGVFKAAKEEAKFVSGEGATKPVLLDPANLNRRVWHLATHGFLNQSDPLLSYVQLAPSGEASTAKLTLEEVWGLDLKRVDLVALSACQTALGEHEPDGSEITSLADSFSGAGAQSVLASLWSVADDSTSLLMTGFYKSLASGKSKAQSLQEAELALLKNRETNHPFFWAPFVLMGDWR